MIKKRAKLLRGKLMAYDGKGEDVRTPRNVRVQLAVNDDPPVLVIYLPDTGKIPKDCDQAVYVPLNELRREMARVYGTKR